MLIPGLCSRSSRATDFLWHRDSKLLITQYLSRNTGISKENKNVGMDAFVSKNPPEVNF